MYPTVIYYSIIARKKNEYINMLPVILVWILSLISRGRGGIISSTVFLIGVYIVKYRSMKLIKKMIVISIFFLAIAIAMLNISYILEKLRTSVIMELFVSNGMNSSRTRFWSEYIELAVSNLKNFVFGANISDTFIGRYLEGNPHNSFIEIHILNGIFSLITIIVLLIKNGIIGLIAYALIYLHYIRTVLVGKESLIFFGMAIITMTLVSMLTENYMVITNIVFGVFFYCFMSSISLWVTPGTGELKNE